MDESNAGLQLILETEKIAYKLKKRIISKPTGNKILVENSRAELILGNEFEKINYILSKFNLRCIIPLKELFEIKSGKVLAWFFINETKRPAIVEKEDRIEFAFDIGKTFLELVNERYYDVKEETHILSNTLIEKLYKNIPNKLRIFIYKKYYKKLHDKLKKSKEFNTLFPIDAAGFVLHNLFIELIKKNSDYVYIEYWPSQYKAVFMLTHDVEPTNYSYKKGIFILLSKLKLHKSTINLVSKYAKKKLIKTFSTENEIGCHGYIHDRKFASIGRKERNERVKKAKKILKKMFGREVVGFRAPALQKSKDLYDILWKNGFKYDMSMIDSQREEPGCGKGVSYNLPYHIFDFKNKRFKKILEIPTAAPDCISPLYFGYSLEDTAKLFEIKKKWIYSIGGVCNFIIHAPAWGKEDAEQRMWLLDNISNIDKKGFWIATGREVNDWWRKRGNILIKNKNTVINRNKDAIEFVICRYNQRRVVSLGKNEKRIIKWNQKY